MQINFWLEIFLYFLSFFLYFFILYNRKKIATKFGTLDNPDFKRKIHTIPIPKTGSYSLALIFLFFLIFNLKLGFFDKDFNIIMLGSLLVFLLGLIDDNKNLTYKTKFFFITTIILLTLNFSSQIIINKIYLITFDTFFNFNSFSIPFTILCLLLLINSLNLSDGINGLATGIVFFWLIYILKIFPLTYNFFIIFILLKLILIFYHNYLGYHFLGDAGSLMLSFFSGVLLIKLFNENINSPNYFLSAEQIFLFYIIPGLDMLRLFFERLAKKRNPFSADKNHLHHLLIKKFSLKKTLIIYFFSMNFPVLIAFYLNLNLVYLILLVIFLYFLSLYYLKKI